MAARKRSRMELENQRRQAAAWYLQHYSQGEIAERLGLSQQMVSIDLQAVRQSWRESAIRDLDAHKAEELARLAVIEAEAWQTWQLSKSAYESTISEQSESEAAGGEVVGEDGKPRPALPQTRRSSRVHISRETRRNLNALRIVESCIDARCKLLGLYAAQRIDLTALVHEQAAKHGLDVAEVMVELQALLAEGNERGR